MVCNFDHKWYAANSKWNFCPRCGKRLESSCPSDATACSRIADPEGKHLEICRIQLARTVKQRDELAAMIERFAEDVDGQGDEILAKQLRIHVREIYSENANMEAPNA